MRRLSSLLLSAALAFAFAPTALAAAPGNDEPSGASLMTVSQDTPYSVSVDTTEATENASDPQQPGPYPSDPSIMLYGTVWFSYTPVESGYLVVDVSTSTYPATVIQLSSTMAFLNLAEPANIFDVTGGQTYYFMAGHKADSGGTLNLTASLPLPDVIDLVIDVAVSGASLDGANLLVSGTWAKVAGNDVTDSSLYVDGTQKGKGKAHPPVWGEGSGSINPDGTWSASIPAYEGTWGPGRTTLALDFYFDNGTTNTFLYPVATVNVPRK